ncbi:MAG: potassium transporter TrkG [Pseudomonadota bacterium]
MLTILSFIVVILLGTGFLMLPIATSSGQIAFIDAIFTATSAVCVTGLTVLDPGTYFTLFGQCVILTLIQVGGLGVMTISVVLFSAMGRSISFRHRMVMQEVFSHAPREDILQVVTTIISFTVVVETLGAIFLFIEWLPAYPLQRAIYLAVFHSISAFCNAGFCLFPDSMMRYSGHLIVNSTICSLIVLGGIGFPVVHNLHLKFKLRKSRRLKLDIQTKTVLVTTATLILLGTGMFWILERAHTLSDKPAAESAMMAIFQSITCRTAGFNTVDIGALNEATLTVMIALMFFGASPGSCGGGVKTTTLALIAAFSWSRIRRKRRVNMFKKSIPSETVNKSISLVLVCVGLIGGILFLILADSSVTGGAGRECENRFLAYLFESVSAFGTVGLSMNLTPLLSSWAKSWIALLMLIGRVGVLTFAYIIVGGGIAGGIEYSEENIMIG